MHLMFAIFSVTDEGVQWVRYILSAFVRVCVCFIIIIKTTHFHPFSDSSEVTSDKCIQASIYMKQNTML